MSNYLNFLLIKAQEEKKNAEETIKAALESVLEKYRGFIRLINKNVKLGQINNDLSPELKQQGIWKTKDGTAYITVQQPYMIVDGRIMWAQDEHREAGKLLHRRTKVFKDEGFVQVEVESEILGSATGTATIGDGETSYVDKTNAIENAETSALGRALGFLGYGILGTGIASADEVVDAQRRLAQLENNKEKDKKTKNTAQKEPADASSAKSSPAPEWVKGKISDVTPGKIKDTLVFGIKLDTGETVIIAEKHPFMKVIDTHKEKSLEFRCIKKRKNNYLLSGLGNVKADGQVVA